MIKFIVGFALGFIIATVGVSGVVAVADKGVASAKDTVKEQAAPQPIVALKPDAKAAWDAELKEASDILRK